MKVFKKILTKVGPTIPNLLKESLAGYRVARSHRNVHASDLTNSYKQFCPREYALLHAFKESKPDEYIDAAQQVAFDIGECYHDLLRNVWLRDKAVGDWKCRYCGYTVIFSKRPKIPCSKCVASNPWEYKECFLEIEGFTGSVDLVVDLGLPKLEIVEIKSMDKDQFKELKTPLGEHRARTELYLYLWSKFEEANPQHSYAGKVNLDSARVLYISKGYGVKNEDEGGSILPFREFVIKRNDEEAQKYHQMALSVAKFKADLDAGVPATLPDRICDTSLTKRAKCCSMAKQCFSQALSKGVFHDAAVG